MLRDSFSVTYDTQKSGPIACGGLLYSGAVSIARAQLALGATNVVIRSECARPGDRSERWGYDVNGRACIVAKPRG
jgi:hypothetical protein